MITKKYYKLIRVSYADSDLFRITNISGQAGTLTVGTPGSTLECSTDGVTWFNYSEPITVSAGANVYMKANGSVSGISMDVNHSIGGNILSLADKTNYSTLTTSGFAVENLFLNDTHLIYSNDCHIGNLNTITGRGFKTAFKGCTNLITGMDLSSLTTVTNTSTTTGFGLTEMYSGCTSLTTPPDLSNLTSIGTRVLQSAFQNCSSLTTSPDLGNLTTIENNGLINIFSNCSSLTTAYAPNVSTWGSEFNNWLNGVAASGTLYCPSQAVADLIPNNSTAGCPSGWTKVVM